MSNLSEVKIFSGENSKYIAEKISDSLNLELGQKTFMHFSDGEFATSYDETVRGDHVFIVQSTFPPSDNLMELLMMIDAAKRASAYKVIAVIPYFGFARQDRKDRPRVAIGAKLVANLLHAAGVDRIMTMDLHADQIQGFFDIPVDHLYGSTVLAPYIRSLKLENLAIASPDIGGSKRANSWAKFFDSGLIICHKTRERPNEVADMKVIGDVRDKNIVIVDDMIDTAGTICKAADILKEKGAKSVRAVATHAVLSGKAYENIEKSALDEVVFTDSIPQRQECSKIRVISVADLFAETIRNVVEHRSISEHFIL
ncbi:MAG: ribose-phosphate pyrophosphokinase [Odoribacter sp.]|nr:ribose-phosphate pyrophosphokinase [Odoribacter sp.]MDY3033922.1 ribose-phosphate pyrophosphokinase [Odoribacter sp.]